MQVSAHDVARDVRYRIRGAGVVVTHKLLYYCQGWHLAWAGKPMYTERIEAWANGPVVADLWHAEAKEQPIPEPKQLDDGQLATIGYVVKRYGHLTGRDLIKLTHSEEPWIKASELGLNAELSHEALVAYFESDPMQIAMRQIGEDLESRGEYRRAIEAMNQSSPASADDDTEALRKLLV
jgi:uncharacterized phage-associated protein